MPYVYRNYRFSECNSYKKQCNIMFMNLAINGTLIWDINIQSGRTYFAYKCTINDPSLKEAGLMCVKGKMVLYGGGDN